MYQEKNVLFFNVARDIFYRCAASSIDSFSFTFPPNPFHLPTPNPRFFKPSKTLLPERKNTNVYFLTSVIAKLFLTGTVETNRKKSPSSKLQKIDNVDVNYT